MVCLVSFPFLFAGGTAWYLYLVPGCPWWVAALLSIGAAGIGAGVGSKLDGFIEW